MIFNTGWFLVFFIAAYAVFFAVPGPRLRFYYLLAASAVFHYHFAGPAGVRPIIALAAATWGLGLLLPRVAGRRRRMVLALAVGIPTLALVFYKYRALLLSTAFSLAGTGTTTFRTGALPLAISFFTFEFIHYLTDVYRGSAPIRDPLRFAFFSIFFPSIVSGPVKRYQPFLAQVEGGVARPDAPTALGGLARVIVGFAKKLVVADNAVVLIHLLEGKGASTPLDVALLMILQSIRILFDFSGYSDIAIGLGGMLGLRLPENFRYPYFARNISDFWQRWHMSLSSWIRDYVYIPLGGSRQGLARRGLNVLLAMALCGLWHGAAWHFAAWGVYHGAGLATQAVFSGSRAGERFRALPASPWIGRAVTFAFVTYGWLLFFYPLAETARLTRTLLGFGGPA